MAMTQKPLESPCADIRPKTLKPAREEDFTCPKCGKTDKVAFGEFVLRRMFLKHVRDGVAVFDTSTDEINWESSTGDPFLYCLACGEEWKLPADTEIDFQ